MPSLPAQRSGAAAVQTTPPATSDLISTHARRNIFGYRSPELEKLIADGAVEPDSAKRKTIYQKANEIMVFDANLIYVATDPRIWAFTNPVKGITYDLSGNMALAGATLEK